jgi:Lyase
MTKNNFQLFCSPSIQGDFGMKDSPAPVARTMPRAIELGRSAIRREHDLLGDADVPADAYWGIHTLRAVENFPITGVPIAHFPDLVRALALVKQAAARANRRLKQLPTEKADAINHACDLIVKDGRFLDQFVVANLGLEFSPSLTGALLRSIEAGAERAADRAADERSDTAASG